MGCGASYIIPFDAISESEHRTVLIFEGMGFTKSTIDEMYTAYHGMDRDNSNSVDPDEWFRAYKLEPIPVYKRFFDIFDLDGSGHQSFSEFVLSVWNFLTYDEKSIGHLIFLLCPRFLQLNSESQKMSESCKVCDLKMVIKALHGKLTAENSAAIDIELTRADDRWPDGTCFPDQVSLFAY